MDEGRKRVIGIMASILASLHHADQCTVVQTVTIQKSTHAVHG